MSAVFNPDKIALDAMIKERQRIHSELTMMDKAIKEMKVRLNGGNTERPVPSPTNSIQLPAGAIPSKLQIRKVILEIMDKINVPCKMNDIQDEYKKITGVDYNIRENVRSLNNQGLLKLMKVNNSNRNAYWVKTEWIDEDNIIDNAIKTEHKFEGFDAMFAPGDLSFH
jgi:hypothetical protein